MKKIIKYSKLLPWLIALNLFSLPSLVFGSRVSMPGDYPEVGVPTEFQTANQVIELIDTIVNYILVALTVISAAFIAFAGFTYVTAGGDEAKVKKAKDYLVWGVFGLVFVVGAKGIIMIIWNLLEG
ncbi:hypothetical protein J7J37_00420 [bacterium]|nr:hypothetical protein [bacterium]